MAIAIAGRLPAPDKNVNALYFAEHLMGHPHGSPEVYNLIDIIEAIEEAYGDTTDDTLSPINDDDVFGFGVDIISDDAYTATLSDLEDE